MKTIISSLVGPMLARRNSRDRMWVLVLLPLMSGCASTGGGTVTTSVEPRRCDAPVLTVLEETPARQQRGDITIVAAADLPQCELATRVGFARRSPSFRERVAESQGNGVALTRQEQPEYRLSTADEFAMILNVTNGSDRVFRGEGSVWAVTIDGSVVPSNTETGLASLLVLPGQTREFPIPAISLNREWQDGVYAFQLYDVAIDRDEAGTVTQRDNFEWLYTLSYQTLEAPPAVTKACGVFYPAGFRMDDYVVREGETDPYAACP